MVEIMEITDLVVTVVKWFVEILSWVVERLPDSPFRFDIETTAAVRMVMGYINYFFPIPYCIRLLSAWLVAILAWYACTVWLRLGKIIS